MKEKKLKLLIYGKKTCVGKTIKKTKCILGRYRLTTRCKKYTFLCKPFCSNCYKYLFDVKIILRRNVYNCKLLAYNIRKFNKDKPVFRKGKFIAPFVGEYVDKKIAYERYSVNQESVYCPNLIKIRKNLYIDTALMKGPAGFAQPNKYFNSKIVSSPYYGLQATCNIYHLNEITYSGFFDCFKKIKLRYEPI